MEHNTYAKNAGIKQKAGRTKLTGKQGDFIEYYCTNGYNGTQAAEDAGYKGDRRQLEVIGSQNLSKLMIRTAVDKKKAEIKAEKELTGEKVIKGFEDIAFQEGNSLQHQALKHKALQDLGKVKGIYELDNLQAAGERARMGEKRRLEVIRLSNIRLAEA